MLYDLGTIFAPSTSPHAVAALILLVMLSVTLAMIPRPCPTTSPEVFPSPV